LNDPIPLLIALALGLAGTAVMATEEPELERIAKR
jgi:hypothetical protein